MPTSRRRTPNAPKPKRRAKIETKQKPVSVIDHTQVFWSSAQACAYLTISKSTLSKIAREDESFPTRIAFGNAYRYKRVDVIAWAHERELAAIEARQGSSS